jgi:hypothetical protein
MTGGILDELIGTAGSGSLDVSGAVTLGGTSALDIKILGSVLISMSFVSAYLPLFCFLYYENRVALC